MMQTDARYDVARLHGADVSAASVDVRSWWWWCFTTG
jgi:hypothetical protein